jgi:hypothetical protein
MVPDTINIVGRGKGMELAPKENCWGINCIILERSVDLHFDMHTDGKMNEKQIARRELVIKQTKQMNIPVYACHAIPETTYIRYPIEDIIKEFRTGYFSNGICYMIALALYKGVKELNFYGVNHTRLNMIDEYTIQKPGVDYWLGVALGRGVKCNIHGVMSEIMIKKYGQKK